ncbi:Protein BTG1 [Turdus rufiventris]|nr:Protein BTG1 [Turdus rufiventris]
MIREIAAAVGFISKFLRTKGLMNERQLQTFSQCLQELLAEHYKHHWFPEKPCKGSGYRCIRINHKMDPLIGQAAQRIGLSSQELFQLLPSELTLWVDPYEVSYRIGEDGSICVLYEAAPAGGEHDIYVTLNLVKSINVEITPGQIQDMRKRCKTLTLEIIKIGFNKRQHEVILFVDQQGEKGGSGNGSISLNHDDIKENDKFSSVFVKDLCDDGTRL